jgi:perosamine synthetase
VVITVARQREIPLFRAHAPAQAATLVARAFESGQLAGGEFVSEFERRLGTFIGNPRIVATGDEASSIAMALFMAGVRPGDEVLASPLACLSCTMPVLNLFAKVVWCDVDPATGSLAVEDAERRVTEHTRAVLVNHWVGYPADIASIRAFANRHDLRLVDNAGEALGASISGRRLGNTDSDFTVFSFYANRHMTTVDGAAIAFARAPDYEQGRWLRRFGIHQPSFRDDDGEIRPESDIPVPGTCNYMSNVAAAIGVAQLDTVATVIARHRDNARFYDAEFAAIPGARPLSLTPGAEPSPWVYSFHAERRNDLLRKLRSQGIAASRVHQRNDVYSCFGMPMAAAPGVDYFAKHNICIPCGWWVSDEDRGFVAACLRSGW